MLEDGAGTAMRVIINEVLLCTFLALSTAAAMIALRYEEFTLLALLIVGKEVIDAREASLAVEAMKTVDYN